MEFTEIQNIHEDCHELFIYLTDFAGQSASTIKLAGISELRTCYEIGRVASQTHLLIFTTAGRGKLHTADGETMIESQTVTVLPAGERFFFELDDTEWHTCWFILEDCKLWQTILDIGLTVFHCREANVVSSTLLLLHQQHELGALHGSSMEADLMDVLIFYIKAAIGGESSFSGSEIRVHDFIDRLSAQLHLPWSTEKIAHELHLSEPHLFRLFKSVTGKSPMQYLCELRMQHACELLKNTNLNIEQVAQCVGYQDGTSFSHRFRKSKGISPGKWKSERRQLTS